MAAERLQKIMAAAGVGSRRHCETLITAGRVQVNGQTITELGAKANPAHDRIVVDGRRLEFGGSHVYYKIHKPRGVLSDIGGEPGERKTVDELLPPDHPRVFPVGRLDVHSEGLVLLTDDGELANRLTHPRYQHPKVYYVLIGEQPSIEALNRLRKGVELPEEGTSAPAEVAVTGELPATLRLSKGPTEGVWLRIVLREGKKRQIRHMTAAVGYPTLRLIRWAIGPLTLGSLELGEYAPLTAGELASLRYMAGLGEAPPPAKKRSPAAGRGSANRNPAARTSRGKIGLANAGKGSAGKGAVGKSSAGKANASPAKSSRGSSAPRVGKAGAPAAPKRSPRPNAPRTNAPAPRPKGSGHA